MSSPSPVIGVIGGIASGKSFVARELAARGAVVLDADRVGHEVLLLPEIEQALHARWGSKVLAADGRVDRRAVAQIVFVPNAQGSAELAFLESLTHPRITERIEREIAKLRASGGNLATGGQAAAIVVDAPLLVEAGWNGFCNRIVYVEAPRALRAARALARGWSQEDFDRREARQESLEVKQNLADVVLDNSGSLESTRAQIERCWSDLVGSH